MPPHTELLDLDPLPLTALLCFPLFTKTLIKPLVTINSACRRTLSCWTWTRYR